MFTAKCTHGMMCTTPKLLVSVFQLLQIKTPMKRKDVNVHCRGVTVTVIPHAAIPLEQLKTMSSAAEFYPHGVKAFIVLIYDAAQTSVRRVFELFIYVHSRVKERPFAPDLCWLQRTTRTSCDCI